MLKLLIADGTTVLADVLADELSGEFCVQRCRDGEATLESLVSFQPDAIVLNLQLPFKDGLTVLQESAYQPRVILAITALVTEYVMLRAAEVGVQYIMLTPTVNALRLRLMDLLATTAPKDDVSNQVAVHLHALNFHTHLSGYRQLCVGIPIFAENPDMLLSKELYPQIAEKLELSDPRTVEHSVRKSITDAWKIRDPVVWEKYFPGAQEAPTNKAFISRIAEFIEQ